MKMKQAAALVLAGAMTLSMAACGSSSGSADSTAASSKAPAASTAASAASSATASAASGAASTASADSQVAKIQSAGKIVMACSADFAPMESYDGSDIVGIDPEIAQKIADKLGVSLEITDLNFDSCIPAMNAGQADFVASGLTVTEDRKKSVDFTDTYFNASQSILVTTDSDIASPADLNGKNVGVQTGTTGDVYCTNEDGTSEVQVGEVTRYNKFNDAVSDLISGRIDAVVLDDYPADKYVEQNSDKIKKLDEALTEEEYAIACPKGSDLVPVINEVISDLKESGELNTIIDKYVSAD